MDSDQGGWLRVITVRHGSYCYLSVISLHYLLCSTGTSEPENLAGFRKAINLLTIYVNRN